MSWLADWQIHSIHSLHCGVLWIGSRSIQSNCFSGVACMGSPSLYQGITFTRHINRHKFFYYRAYICNSWLVSWQWCGWSHITPTYNRPWDSKAWVLKKIASWSCFLITQLVLCQQWVEYIRLLVCYVVVCQVVVAAYNHCKV